GPMLLLGFDLFGKTLGIVGAGRIGTAVARRAGGFGMRLLYAGTRGRPEMDSLGASCVSLERLLEESDVVSLHVPLTPTTHHLIDAHALDRMKPTALLINTSRGPVIDEAALVQALRSGRIAGAGLDVYEREPALHPALCQLPNTVLLPHVGSATVETRGRMAAMAARSLLAMLQGESPPNLLNPEVIGRHRLAGRTHGG
ncbi:MAG: D-glycerate dehydrogenase, partial [Candidatus Eisenbacteria bacterium]|nr:D-glycerate dehydrogenase [Candidatus Eisenbacteria bacterium]